jgi:hypothetical protein
MMRVLRQSALARRLLGAAGWGACAGLLAMSLPQTAKADQDA